MSTKNPTITLPTTSLTAIQSIPLTITGITVGDPGGTTEQLTLSVKYGSSSLSFGNTTGLTVTGNGTSSVTVTGNLADLQTDLATLSYTSNYPYNGTDTLSLRLKDTTNKLTTTSSLPITLVGGQPPTITLPTTSLTAIQSTPLTITGITVGDPGGTTEQLTLSVKYGSSSLSFGNTTGLTVTGNGTSSVTVTGNLADLQTDLATLSYTSNYPYNGTDTLSLRLKDTTNKLTTTSSLPITLKTQPPTITLPKSLTVNPDTVSPITGITVGDLGGTKERLTLSVSNGTINFGNTTGLTLTGGSYGSNSVTVSGDLANLQTDLATLSYTSNASYRGTDTLSLGLTDTTNKLTTNSSLAITVAAPPTLTLPTSRTVSVNIASTISGIHIGDPDGSSVRERLTLSVSNGTINFGNTTGLTLTGGSYGSSSLTVRGNLHYLRKDLATLTYTSNEGYQGTDTLSLRLVNTTNNLFAKDSLAITVAAPPTLTLPTTSLTAIKGTQLPISGIIVGDPAGTTEQLSLSVTHASASLSFGNTTGLTVTSGSYGSSSVTVTGDLADLQTDLATLSYTSHYPSNGTDTLSLILKDTTNNLKITGSLPIALEVHHTI